MYDVIVIGGGLAGCSAAITLSGLGQKVLLIERLTYPVHKICGEFLSVEVAETLQKLGAFESVLASGASPITNFLVSDASGKRWQTKLPGTAYGLSRYRFDKLLFDRAAECGVDTISGTSVLRVEGELSTGFSVHTAKSSYTSRVVIGAYGKNSNLIPDKRQSKGVVRGDFVGFKEHHTGQFDAGTIEVHMFDRGYCGINGIEDGVINVCWFAERSLLTEYGGHRESIVQNVMSQNTLLASRLDALTPVADTFCAVGSVSLAGRGHFQDDICLVGDSAQVIAPFCGDGMAMALLSGGMAAQLASQFVNGEISRTTFMQRYIKEWKWRFGLRIAIGQTLQSLILSPVVASVMLSVVNRFPATGNWLVVHTRSTSKVLQPDF